jgi:hypothetical protein
MLRIISDKRPRSLKKGQRTYLCVAQLQRENPAADSADEEVAEEEDDPHDRVKLAIIPEGRLREQEAAADKKRDWVSADSLR